MMSRLSFMIPDSSPWEHSPAQQPGCYQLRISTMLPCCLIYLLWMETWLLCSCKEGNQVSQPRVVPEYWRQRFPRPGTVGICFRQMHCASLHLLPTNLPLQGIHSGLILLFFSLTKGRNRVGRKAFILENCSVHSRSYYSIDQFAGPGSSAETMLNRAWARKPQFL